jgi:dipeptidyl aminopeptidase/acylaminoacyl peptidase
MIDANSILNLKYPSRALWSPKGDKIAYITGLYSKTGYDTFVGEDNTLMVYNLSSRQNSTVATKIPGPGFQIGITDFRWTPDGKYLIYNKNKTYYKAPVNGGEEETLISGKKLGDRVQLSPDGGKLSFISDGDIWIKNGEGEPYRITEGEKLLSHRDHNELPWPQWSPDSSKIAFHSVKWQRQNIGVVPIEVGETTWMASDRELFASYFMDWSPDSSQLALVRSSKDGKRAELVVCKDSGEIIGRPCKSSTDKFVIRISMLSSWSNDGERISFVCNRNGWNHLHVFSLDSGDVTQLTKGDYEVVSFTGEKPVWSPDDKWIIYLSNREMPQERGIWTVPSVGGESSKLVHMKGKCGNISLSPNGNQLAFTYSGPKEMRGLWIAPELNSTPVQIHKTSSDKIKFEDVPEVQAVTFNGPDGLEIPSILLTRKNLRRDQKHPAIIYGYGGGLVQDAVNTLGVFDLNRYLASKGYVVLIIDPRGSLGYGNEYATSIHLDCGGRQIEDVVKGTEYLTSLGFVDPEKIGLWGASYGGFLTTQTLIDFPDSFAAGLVWNGVFDWKYIYDYNTSGMAEWVFIVSRWGYPEEQTNLYHKKSPIKHVDKIKTPLLILQGEVDINCPLSEAIRFVDTLIKAGKKFDFMIYPGEPHSYLKKETWLDVIDRVESFFNRHLRNKKPLE